jgi:maleylacetate reductase
VSNPYWNPRPFGPAERGAIRALLQRAYEGAPPA